MTQEIKYGVISDVHQDPRIVPIAIDILKNQGAEKLILNGDIGNYQRTLEDSQNYVALILDSAGKSGLESFVQPGSHETLGSYGPVIEHFSNKYSNIVDVIKNPKIEQNGHHLVFLPGSDFLCGGEYQLGNQDQLNSGSYFVSVHNELISEPKTIEEKKELQRLGELGKISGMIHYTKINDLKKLVTEPDKSIIICHVPRKFDKLDTAVDMAEFGIATDTIHRWGVEFTNGQSDILYSTLVNNKLQNYFKSKGVKKIISGDIIYAGSVTPYMVAKDALVKAPLLPIEIRKENRGNEALKNIYEELGIHKAVSGHFHESGHRANDRNGNPVPEGTMADELFWNSGHLDAGQTGILTICDGKLSYKNIQLQDYLK